MQCTLTKQQQQKQPHTSVPASIRNNINIPQLWVGDESDWPGVALALAQHPAQRSVTKNRNPFIRSAGQMNITAAVGQCVGIEAAHPCDSCSKDKHGGKFSGGCIVAPPAFAGMTGYGCCFSCMYQKHYSDCSFIQKKE
ncbi:hypothetical protein F4801DRAFT_558998 [Xylaria longipes]|nr:hypothetical protein F4801DRAFT_558998 [Xylaria longipes]